DAARAASGVIAISGGVRDDLIRIGVEPAKLTVEHDAFEPSRFAGLPSREEARRALDLPLERPLVVYTGGLLAWKGVDVLVDAARELPEVQFVIAGGMDADVALLSRHADGLANVRFDGFQAPGRVGLYLAAGDLGVVPNRSTPELSAKYTSPLKVFEAMATGLPLVASDLPSLRDILDEDTARFVAPDVPKALAQGLRAVLADDAERRRLATNLAARADEHTWDARAARLLDWMETRA
ncbi:MAG: glycosyltransferase family 4 protein, partial [Planctomycetota bacterium]|nr:glycosyltransferase family 4 protein [Planctomycetota bacterium]